MASPNEVKDPTHLQSPDAAGRDLRYQASLSLVQISSSNALPRLVDIDLLRGIAVVLMVGFHLTYDLKTFANLNVALPAWYWRSMPHIIGWFFLSLVGLSAWLMFSAGGAQAFSLIMRKGLKLCGLAAGVTVITALTAPGYAIYFGVLHCIGVSTLLCYPFLRFRRNNLKIGIVLIVAAIALAQFRVSFFWLFWLGVWPDSGTGGDWYPLVPWFGVVLIGIWIGERLYPYGTKRRSLISDDLAQNIWIRGFRILGQHSLLIYLIHQPLLLGGIYLVLSR